MIYAGDLGIQYPVKDLYDKTIMLMSIAAAKDMYEKGQQQLKDFYKDYGDFISPILKDMDWYNQNVTGKVRDTINNLYANGIDPLRSAEGRAAIALLIYSMPTGDIAERRQSAETAKEFLKNKAELEAKGLYDEDFERSRHGGLSLSDWDTGKNGVWNTRSPGIYQDYNTWTHHLFDDMKLSFDEEETKKYPGYIAYTKSRDTMNTIVDTNIAALLNSDLGKYRLQQILDTIPENMPNRRALAVEELKRRVIDANYEQNRIKLELDPYALARYLNRLRGSSSGGGSGRHAGQKISYNWMNGLFQRGLTSAFGYDSANGEVDALNNLPKDQIKFGQSAGSERVYSGPWEAYKDKETAYVNQFTIYEVPAMFPSAIGRDPLDKNGSVALTKEDLQYIRTTQDVVTHTYGYNSKKLKNDISKLENLINSAPEGNEEESGITMVPHRDVYTSFQDYENVGAIEQQWKIAVYDSNGKKVGDYWYTIPNGREYTDDVPRITEWKVDKDGNYYAPKTSKGEERGRAKSGINKKVRGWNEWASYTTSRNVGVSGLPFNLDVNYNPEGVASSPYR